MGSFCVCHPLPFARPSVFVFDNRQCLSSSGKLLREKRCGHTSHHKESEHKHKQRTQQTNFVLGTEGSVVPNTFVSTIHSVNHHKEQNAALDIHRFGCTRELRQPPYNGSRCSVLLSR